jgi:predicted hotdog family 3-hydroxylacyl-ACP dehydratase
VTLDRIGIERLVPHAGAMCLLERVTDWNDTLILCAAAAPDASHPLARDGALPAVAACEYAAQATAVHGALLDGVDAPRAGMLAKLMGIELHRACFPGTAAGITVRAELLSRMDRGCLYAFAVAADGEPVAAGRLIVAFAAGEPV